MELCPHGLVQSRVVGRERGKRKTRGEMYSKIDKSEEMLERMK
jgi:hypothetical protein